MQVSRTFQGSIAAAGSSAARQISYGLTNTIAVYANRVDFVNQSIADFLHNDCGVDAAYEARAGSTAKFLWIYGVPFLFSTPAASTYSFNFYGPFHATALQAGGTGTNVISGTSMYATSLFFANSASATNYDFTLFFDGDPDNGFILRYKSYGRTVISGYNMLMFAKATNILNGKDAVIWKYGVTAVGNSIQYCNGVDIHEDGTMDQSSFDTNAAGIEPVLLSKHIHKTNNPGKFPLVPLMIGVWKPKNLYKVPIGFGLSSSIAQNDMQTVSAIAGRKFIVTCLDGNTLNVNYINAGLIEVPS